MSMAESSYQAVVFAVSFHAENSNMPTLVFERPVTIHEIKPVESIPVKLARLNELLYSCGRSATFCDDFSEVTNILNWSMFSAKTVDKGKQNTESILAYNPIVMSKPTDYSTAYTTLLRAKEVANALGQTHIPVVFYMGLLSKAFEIVWSQNDTFNGVFLWKIGCICLFNFCWNWVSVRRSWFLKAPV
ncbi:hypothetical protein DPMN_164120 [Dreissena polymorpha]|uniref:Uncharacterized protein n=1 Tax=Dreissena polymorpha TaxID=45954 RepID=A0A9D4IS22_DREPO|nr:hypothetical protein DPMN_164120 [Dreissena polymorpha]